MTQHTSSASGPDTGVKPYANERPLFMIQLIINCLIWLLLIIGTVGIALIYVLIFFIIYLFAQSAFIAWIKGTGTQITAEQFPDLHERLQKACLQLKIQEPPQAYLLEYGGFFNALATRFLNRHYIVLLASLVDALEERPDSLDFYIGHELGHIKAGHLSFFKGPFLIFTGWLPLIGAAYRRAQEYTCDRYGSACCNTPDDAEYALAVLSAGAKRWRSINREAYIAQTRDCRGFWMSLHELVSDYPWLTKRMLALRILNSPRDPVYRTPPRNPLAYVFALFIPRFNIGNRAGGIFFIFIFAIIAAIAIPAYKDFKTKLQEMDHSESQMYPYGHYGSEDDE